MTMAAPPPHERDALAAALAQGSVPSLGLRHIQIGRMREVAALMRDLERIADGGAAFRLVVGESQAGKSFFLALMRLAALERGLVTAHAALASDRRLHATSGAARALLAEMMRNLATLEQPEGGALRAVVERFLARPADEIREGLADLRGLLGGSAFVEVLAACRRGAAAGEEALKADALRWLGAGMRPKARVRQAASGVRGGVDDAAVYDHLKLIAALVRHAGFGGLLVLLDDLDELRRLRSAQARSANYEQILRIVNDVLQGGASGLGFILAARPETLRDAGRGLASYPALGSRLVENRFAKSGLVDLSGPVIPLERLSREDIHALLVKVRDVVIGSRLWTCAFPDDAVGAYIDHCRASIGEECFTAPRLMIEVFIRFLEAVEQSRARNWRSLLEKFPVERKPSSEAAGESCC